MFTAKFGAMLLAPCMALMGFLGLGGHLASSTIATSTATSTLSVGAKGWFGWHWGPGPVHIVGTTTPATSTPPVITPSKSTPSISSMSTTSAAVGTAVTLTGSGFSGDDIVNFGAGAIKDVAVANSGTELTFTIPSSVGPYCGPGVACPMYEILVTNGIYKVSVENVATKAVSNSVELTVTGSASLDM